MCGIAGIFQWNNTPVEPGLIRRMTDALSHRGPDSDGFFEEGGVALGHRRLSIIDLSSAANQPFFDNTERYVMVFNGEMYNYRQVKQLLGDYDFRTTSDTEALIAAYVKWGADCMQHFRGMYAFAIWDRQDRQLFIARDRLGVKPLYFHLDGTRLLFSSEIRSILASGLVKRRLDHAALADYFSYQSVGYPYSMIEGIGQLEAGSWMRIGHDGSVEKKMYWKVTDTVRNVDFSDKAQLHSRIRALMLQSVERRLVSDVPVGAFLSGGIDSSAIVGLMAEAGNTRPNTFTVAFEEKEFDESPYAHIISKKFDTRHTDILLKPTVFLDELHNALDAMDIPSGDGINTYVVSKAISRHGMRVALSGAGGDELFAGYPFFNQYLSLRAKEGWWRLPSGLRKLSAAIVAGGQAQGRRNRLGQLLRLSSPAIDQSYPVFRQLLSPQTIRQLLSPEGRNGNVTAVERELSSRRNELAALPLLSQVSAAEYLGYTQNTLLKDTDQMSMSVSLEVREPFFDQDLVEFVLAIPDPLKKTLYPKSLLVESLKPLLPDEIVFRKKQGFLFPWTLWLRTDLKEFCAARLQRMAERAFINGPALMDYWRRFLAGDKNVRWGEIWLFVVLEYWLEKNMIS